MAKRNIVRYYVNVNQEGQGGTVRGKLSAVMCKELGAEAGSVIEIEVDGGTIVGGHVLTKREKKERDQELAREAKAKKVSAPVRKAAKPIKGNKPVVKKKGKKAKITQESEAPVKSKKGKKSSKRATKVSYESEAPVKKKKKNKGKK